MTERPALDTEVCSRCGHHTGFEWSEDEGGFVSVCCAWPEQKLPADAS